MELWTWISLLVAQYSNNYPTLAYLLRWWRQVGEEICSRMTTGQDINQKEQLLCLPQHQKMFKMLQNGSKLQPIFSPCYLCILLRKMEEVKAERKEIQQTQCIALLGYEKYSNCCLSSGAVPQGNFYLPQASTNTPNDKAASKRLLVKWCFLTAMAIRLPRGIVDCQLSQTY